MDYMIDKIAVGFNKISIKNSHIIHFKVECGYEKIQSMMSVMNKAEPFTIVKSNLDIIKELLSDKICSSIISDYYSRHMSFGKYYTYKDAVRFVKERRFNHWDEEAMIKMLTINNKKCNINEVMSCGTYGTERINYSLLLEYMLKRNINPICLPDEWGIDSMPALLTRPIVKE